MSEPTAHVYVDLDGTTHFVGRLWTSADRGKERASFEYDNHWLANDARFALEPALTLDPAPHQTRPGRSLFGAMGDSAPDRWGRTLLQRQERAIARAKGRSLRTLHEIDYLLAVTDEVRPGALRFSRRAGGPFERPASAEGIPPIVTLPALLAASDAAQEDEQDSDEAIKALQLLLAPGSSLGGARPKASVRDANGRLHIAKFPARTDEWNIQVWEALALTLAGRAAIVVPTFQLARVSERDVLILERFDRIGDRSRMRLPFLSAMSALDARDREIRSYVELAEFLRQHGANTAADLHALWRRIVFMMLINNTDDHLRNHGFLLGDSDGWRLSPAYDLNPVPADNRARYLSTAVTEDGDTTASLELAIGVAEQFGLGTAEARAIAGEVAKAVADWLNVARTLKIPDGEISRVSSAFEHPELSTALRHSPRAPGRSPLR